MTASELGKILEMEGERGPSINSFADVFRKSGRLSELLEILNSSEPKILTIGTWIAGEVRYELPEAELLVVRLIELLEHDDWRIRFNAVCALFPFLEFSKSDTESLFEKLKNDPNESVRSVVSATFARLDTKSLGGKVNRI